MTTRVNELPAMTKPMMLALADYHESQARWMKNRANNSKCQNCAHWSNTCNKWQSLPPVEVQRIGCDDWTFDEIPF